MPRYMKKQTIEELKVFIQEIARKSGFDLDGDDADESIEYLLGCLVLSSESHKAMSKVEKDLYKDGGFEEAFFPTVKELASGDETGARYFEKVEWVGFHTLEGRTFYGGFLASDWAYPCFVAIYQDDKGFMRGYMPKKGNGLNPINKLSFYEDDEADDAYARSKGFEDADEMREENPNYEMELYDSEVIKQELLKRLIVR